MSLLESSVSVCDDSSDEGECEQHGVEEEWYNADGADAGERAGHEQLCSIGQQALYATGGGVQQAGTAPRVDVVLLRDASGNVADREYGDGVIGGAEVGERDQSAYAPFCAVTRFDTRCDTVDDIFQPSVMTDECEDSSCQHGDEYEFAHAHDAVERTGYPSHQVITAVQHTGDTGEGTSDDEDDEYVHAACSADKHSKVWDEFGDW